MSEFWFAVFWAITGGVLAVLGTLPFHVSGRDSENERRQAQRNAECERCMDAMQERMEERVHEYGRLRYLQALEDARGTGKKVYLEEVTG